MDPFVSEWPPEGETYLRRRLGSFYKSLGQEAEEGLLAARGIESRRSVESLVVMAAARQAEHYAALNALLPDGVALHRNPARISLAVTLMPLEVEELAVSHDEAALRAERDGNQSLAQRRRERAEQLREMVQERRS